MPYVKYAQTIDIGKEIKRIKSRITELQLYNTLDSQVLIAVSLICYVQKRKIANPFERGRLIVMCVAKI